MSDLDIQLKYENEQGGYDNLYPKTKSDLVQRYDGETLEQYMKRLDDTQKEVLQAQKALVDETVDSVALRENVEQRYSQLEATYAQDLFSAKQQLADMKKTVKETVVYLSDFPRKPTETDDTGRIQRAVTKADEIFISSNEVGGSLYYQTRVTVIFDATTYTTSERITLNKGVSIASKGHTIIEAKNPDQSQDCFSTTYGAGVFRAKGFTFIGYRTALELGTADVDVSLIALEDLIFHHCSVGVDTISFPVSRSTLLVMDNCKEFGTDVFLKNYTDKAVVKNSWFYHTGYGGANILNFNNLIIDSCIAVPNNQPEARWIDNHETEEAQGGLILRDTRFGAEFGGIPVVFNYARYTSDLSSNMGRTILMEGCQLSSAGTKGVIHLFAVPNQIKMASSFGFYDGINGIITIDPTAILPAIGSGDFDLVTIDLDHSIYQSTDFPKISGELLPFLHENKPLPYSKKSEHHFTLPVKHVNINGIGEQTVYNIGIVNDYSKALVELEIVASVHNTPYFAKKKMFIPIGNLTTHNSVAEIYNAKIVTEYEADEGYPVFFTPKVSLLNGKLIVSIKNDTNETQNYVVRGNVSLPYVGNGGRPVFLNE